MISLMKSCGCFAQVAKEALLVITHTKLQAVLINRPKHWRKFGSQGKQERNIFYLSCKLQTDYTRRRTFEDVLLQKGTKNWVNS